LSSPRPILKTTTGIDLVPQTQNFPVSKIQIEQSEAEPDITKNSNCKNELMISIQQGLFTLKPVNSPEAKRKIVSKNFGEPIIHQLHEQIRKREAVCRGQSVEDFSDVNVNDWIDDD
jgi:hypothetical protein